MARALSEDLRARIAEALPSALAGGESVRSFARRFGVSPATISTFARKMGSDPLQRSQTQNATQAKVADNAARRAAIASRLLDVAERALSDMEQPAVIYNFGGKDNTYNERKVDRPPTGDRRNLATIAAITLDKHKMLDGYDADRAAASAVDDWLGHMLGRSKA